MLSTRMSYIAVGLLFLMGSADLARADVIIMKVTSDIQGVFQGENTRTGQEDTISVLGFAMGVDSQRELIDGNQILVGERLFQPVTISKLIDKTTPQFFDALFNNDNLVEIQISFYRPSRDSRGKEELYYTLTLSEAAVSNISQDRPSGEHATVETISFVFDMISVMSEETGQEAVNMEAPPSFIGDLAP